MMTKSINRIEKSIITSLHLNYNLKLIEASFSEGYISKYILLDRTRNIHSYYELAEIVDDDLINRLFINHKIENVFLELSRIQYSTLDRPSFLIIRNKVGVLQIINIADVRRLFLKNKFSFNSVSNLMIPIIDIIVKIHDELK